MSAVLLGLLGVVALAFAVSVAVGAPWLPTRRKEAGLALDLLQLQPGQTLIDLGSGTGSLLREAAQRDIKAIGYEVNPLLYIYSLISTWKYRHLVRINCKNYWNVELPATDGMYVFLIGHYMQKLDQKLQVELPKGTLVVSYAFKIPNRKIIDSTRGLFLYRY